MRSGGFRLIFEIVEKFFTLSGEAPRAGHPMYLIRFSGCNLDCNYCDTGYHREVELRMSPEELRADIEAAHDAYPAAFVLFTGGEPLLGERQKEVARLASCLSRIEFLVETNGSLPLREFDLPNLRYVIDWKTGSSGHGNSFCMANLEHLRPGLDCVKFVVSAEDLAVLPEQIAAIRRRSAVDVYLSPQWGRIDLPELAAFIVDRRLDAALSLQLHKVVWGEKRGV